MRALANSGDTNFVSFSGIDGAGKSTQIEALRTLFEQDGRCVVTIRFWDDIAGLTWLRESAGHKVFKGDKGIGSPSRPINRRDKNVQSFPMTCVRLLIYLVDAISTRHAVKRALRSGADLTIFDRYMYDEFANLNLHNPFIRAYVKLVMKIVPRPHISYLLDADPEQARARKPEYPLEFLHTNRKAYLELNALIGGMTVIAPTTVKDVRRAVIGHALTELSLRRVPKARPPLEKMPEANPPSKATVGSSTKLEPQTHSAEV
jgi:thymidylate kinase